MRCRTARRRPRRVRTARSCCSTWVECPIHRGSVLHGHMSGSRRPSRWPATSPGPASGGATVDLSELLIEYANVIVSRAVLGDESARGLFDDGDSGHRQREGVHRLPKKLIGTRPVRELLPWLGWVDAINGLEGEDHADVGGAQRVARRL